MMHGYSPVQQSSLASAEASSSGRLKPRASSSTIGMDDVSQASSRPVSVGSESGVAGDGGAGGAGAVVSHSRSMRLHSSSSTTSANLGPKSSLRSNRAAMSTMGDIPELNVTPDDDGVDQDTSLPDHNAQPSQDGPPTSRSDKASRLLGIKHEPSMEPIPARNSLMSTRDAGSSTAPSLPLASLYVVSGLPKNPHTWTLADPDAVLGLSHSDGAVNRWWRPEVLGSTVSPGVGGTTKKKKRRGDTDAAKGAGALSKQEVGKMLSKALKLSFTREVEIVASTLQPASTIHTFTFNLPAPNTPLTQAPSTSDLLRSSVFTASDNRGSVATLHQYPYSEEPARPSSAYLGPSLGLFPPGHASTSFGGVSSSGSASSPANNQVTYHGVCLTVWSHADAERSAAIRRTLESSRERNRKESAQSLVSASARLKSMASAAGEGGSHARRPSRKSNKSVPWHTDAETDAETEAALSESEYEMGGNTHGPGESTLFLPGDTVFWLPYALTLVSRHPIYDLMRDYLTLSWARFSKDVQAHTLQISKILSAPAPRPGDLVKLDASTGGSAAAEQSLEVVARFPGGLDFGKGLVDINFTMWPLFKCLNIDNILTICEIALAPTGRVLFFSRHPALLGIAVSTIKYLVELRGWNGIALPAVHSRDAKIYADDPGPWIMGLATEARYSIRPPSEVCVVDLDINYLNCASPPPGAVSVKQQREKFRQKLLAAFESDYHPDHCVPVEFKEAFPAGRFRPLCKIQAKRGASNTAVADGIKAPEWWHSTRIIQAFDSVLQDKFKKPSFLKRISSFGSAPRTPKLTQAEMHIQLSIRKRATAFVDARDELETKIGRLSRRLNFLMTESDLWRDKFVTFEAYAEKLSAEATQLRVKITKEQKETKRISGMFLAEKSKLEQQLREKETEQKEAQLELQRMRENMERMEIEREEMVREVEAQIERALASMAVDVDESDYEAIGGSRPSSRLSSRSAPNPSLSRRGSDAALRSSSGRNLRSFSTDSTLVESFLMKEKESTEGVMRAASGSGATDTIVEADEESDPPVKPKPKRFSASHVQGTGVALDGMSAVDAGIHENSETIAQKMLEIQQKLEHALDVEGDHLDNRRRSESRGSSSPSAGSDTDAAPRATSPRRTRRTSKSVLPPGSIGHKTHKAKKGSKSRRSIDSARTAGAGGDGTPTTSTVSDEGANTPQFSEDNLPSIPSEPRTPTIHEYEISVERPTPRGLSALRTTTTAAANAIARAESSSTPAMTPTTPALSHGGTSVTTDESDTDFMSAYSTSPRGSIRSKMREEVDEGDDDDVNDTLSTFLPASKVAIPTAHPPRRQRMASSATVQAAPGANHIPSPTPSESTVASHNTFQSPAV